MYASVPDVESAQMAKTLIEKAIRVPLSAEDLQNRLQTITNDNIWTRESKGITGSNFLDDEGIAEHDQGEALH